IVKGARMDERTGPVGVEKVHHLPPSAKGTEAHAATHVLAEGGEVWRDAAQLLQPTRRVPAGHHLVKDKESVGFRRSLTQSGQELGTPWDAAARSHHRVDNNGSDLTRVRAGQIQNL